MDPAPASIFSPSSKLKKDIVQKASSLRCSGTLSYYRGNCYTYVGVLKEFSQRVTSLLSEFGFNPIPCRGGAYMPPLPHFGNFLRTYVSEEAPTIL